MSFTVAETDDGNADFSWTVFHDDLPVMRASGLRTPDNVLELVAVPWGAPPADIWCPASVFLLNDVTMAAARHHFVAVRTLVWDHEPSFPKSALESAEFSHAATLQGWTDLMTADSASDCLLTIRRLAMGHPLSPVQKKALTRLLRECLQDSQDLQTIPALNEATLLATWQALRDSELIVAAIDGRDVGLAVVSREVDRQAATLEYLGVSIPFRRRGYGRRLLREAQSVTENGDIDCPSSRTRLTAWCDLKNVPGMQLYQNSGFEPTVTGHLWIHPVESEN